MKFHNNPLETMGPETCQFTLERSLCMPGVTWHELLCKNLGVCNGLLRNIAYFQTLARLIDYRGASFCLYLQNTKNCRCYVISVNSETNNFGTLFLFVTNSVLACQGFS